MDTLGKACGYDICCDHETFYPRAVLCYLTVPTNKYVLRRFGWPSPVTSYLPTYCNDNKRRVQA